MAGFWSKRRRENDEQQARSSDAARKAQAALVAADERIRLVDDEIVFAEAELGPGAVQDLRDALESVRTHMWEAYHLHQLNHDEIPDTAQELHTRYSRILQLCEWAEDLLDDRMAALAEPIERARRAPETIAKVRADAVRVRDRVPHARETVARLAARYAPSALESVAANPGEAEQLVGFAEHSAAVAERRREAGQREQANLALEAATESVRRAGTLVEAVETFEVEALRAESTLAAIVEDSRGDLVVARSAPQVPAVTQAMNDLQAALSELPAAGVNTDPFSHLTRLRDANSALDAAIARAREREARPAPDVAHVQHAIDDADRQLAVARDVIAGHRGWIGADARTRLAEAERVRADLDRTLSGSAAAVRALDEDGRERALEGARRCAQLASDALQYARRDIDGSRPQVPQPQQWGGPMEGFGRRGGGGGDLVGGILGGLVIGSILDGIFD